MTSIPEALLSILYMLDHGCVLKCWGPPETAKGGWISRPEVPRIKDVKKTLLTTMLSNELIQVSSVGDGEPPNGVSVLVLSDKGRKVLLSELSDLSTF